MYNEIFFKHKFKHDLYKNFIEEFRNKFDLIERKKNKKIYFLENEKMRVVIQPKYIEVLLDGENSAELETKLRKYFNN